MQTDDLPSTTIDTPFDAALSERYLVYALSTITARSLPDVRDGLKPVHRRLLWAMRLLRLDPAGAYKKSARVVGDVIGKYHPHGDQSVYDAMVRLAQDFALRYPLVDGQGNFGNIDGDNAAAYRYTEAKLTPIAMQLMAGLDEGTVDFRPTYNGEEEEPEVFPGLFPNLLANGASGIAVGMATSIPPHNVGELIDAAEQLIDNPKIDDRALMQFVKGPDFPTGGVLVDDEDVIARAYVSGRGSFRLRARIEVEREKGGGWHLLVSEIPYGVPKAKLIEQIAQLIADKKLPILADVRDESDEQVRLILEPRARTVEPDLLLESLFRLTDLEIRFPLNLNVLDATRTPGVMSLKEALTAWLAFQLEVLVRRSEVRIGKIDERLGAARRLPYRVPEPRPGDRDHPLRGRAEADADERILAQPTARPRRSSICGLRSLRRLEEMEIGKERAALAKEREELVKLVAEPGRQRRRLRKDLAALKDEVRRRAPAPGSRRLPSLARSTGRR